MSPFARPFAGYAAIAGGVMGLLLAPMMVIVKYMTGWAVVPRPAWVPPAQEALSGLLGFGTPAELWTAYGSLYTLALLLMLVGLLGLYPHLKSADGRASPKGFWVLVAGLCMVVPGDAIHSWTWHQDGLAVPTPGTNPVANTAYAVHMMGMNFVMAGCLVLGVSALRRKLTVRWLGWSLVLVFPAAVVASTTVLPTTPSGALWLFSATMAACGYSLVAGHSIRRTA